MVTTSSSPCVTPLFVPGDRPDRFAKAITSGADAIIIDLEDAVAQEAKTRARDAVFNFRSPGEFPIYVRINGTGTPWFADDLKAISQLPWAGVVLPKTESIDDIKAVRDLTGMDRPLIILIESAVGIANIRTIVMAGGILRLGFGSVDYCADLGCTPSRDALLLPRTEIVLASRLARLDAPLDGVTLEINGPAVIEDDARYAAGLGFGGKLCIHPEQIAPARTGFVPGADELDWARKVLALNDDSGAVTVNGQLVDAAVRRRAIAILARAMDQGFGLNGLIES